MVSCLMLLGIKSSEFKSGRAQCSWYYLFARRRDFQFNARVRFILSGANPGRISALAGSDIRRTGPHAMLLGG